MYVETVNLLLGFSYEPKQVFLVQLARSIQSVRGRKRYEIILYIVRNHAVHHRDRNGTILHPE